MADPNDSGFKAPEWSWDAIPNWKRLLIYILPIGLFFLFADLYLITIVGWGMLRAFFGAFAVTCFFILVWRWLWDF